MRTIKGDSGNDTLNGSNRDDSITGFSGNDFLLGNAGNDILDGSAGFDDIQGGDGNDLIFGGSGNDTLDGGVGNDTIFGDLGNDFIVGGDGDDELHGSIDGFATLGGGEGNDVLTSGQLGGLVVGAGGDDTLIAKFHANSSFNEMRLFGGSGSDTFKIGSQGGRFNDVVIYDFEGGETLDLSYFGSIPLVFGDGGAGGDKYLTVSQFSDSTIIRYIDDVDFNQGSELQISFTTSIALAETSPGSKLLQVVRSINGISGTESADTIAGTAGSDDIYGFEGNDRLSGDEGDDILYGDIGNDTLLGGASTDTLDGSDGNDVLDGGTDADSMLGGKGNDLFTVDNAQDIVVELTGGGTDTVQASISHTLTDNVEHLTLTGSSNTNGTGNKLNNQLIGNSGNNKLSGAAGNDSINGGTGNDTLSGGTGRDTLTGGDGADVFAFATSSEAGQTQTSADVISDFIRGSDKIDLSRIDANTAVSGNNTFSFVGTSSFDASNASGELRFVFDTTSNTGMLLGSIDADSDAEFFIRLTGVAELSAADVIL